MAAEAVLLDIGAPADDHRPAWLAGRQRCWTAAQGQARPDAGRAFAVGTTVGRVRQQCESSNQTDAAGRPLTTGSDAVLLVPGDALGVISLVDESTDDGATLTPLADRLQQPSADSFNLDAKAGAPSHLGSNAPTARRGARAAASRSWATSWIPACGF